MLPYEALFTCVAEILLTRINLDAAVAGGHGPRREGGG